MIRQAIDSDIEQIRLLMQSELHFWQDGWRSDVIERGIKSSNGLAFIVEENSRITGFICVHDLGFRAYISVFIVHKDRRGKGIGKSLLDKVEQELRTRGCNVLIVDVWRNAESFYRECGYEPPDVILLSKNLFY